MERIIVENVWKEFSIGADRKQGALEKIVSALSGREPRKNFWALEDISFTAKAGEIIGIIGRNASGKSTLLRIIAGIYKKDKGYIRTNGVIVPLIGMDAGLNIRSTAKDNIHLCCSILGLKQKAIRKKFEEIISFAELESFVNTKLYQFSSGMIARLSFSIAINSAAHAKPEILLLDEVFAVGDEHFINKSIAKLKGLIKSGATVLFVSHDLHLLNEHCQRFIWIENGKLVKDGGEEALKEYVRSAP